MSNGRTTAAATPIVLTKLNWSCDYSMGVNLDAGCLDSQGHQFAFNALIKNESFLQMLRGN
jgi:hypothetical protein